MKVNMKMISQITGYSQSTISNVLNNKKGTNRQTAEEILRVAREIGYLSTSKIENIKLVFYKKSGEVLTETPLINDLIDPSSVVVLGKFRRFHLPIFSLFLPNLVFSYIYGIFSMPFGGFFY